jgi:hypothetical protein
MLGLLLAKTKGTFCVTLITLLGAALLATCAQATEPLDVRIKNFPDTQRVKGSVSIDGIVSHGRSQKFENLVVPSAKRNELSELVFAGMVDMEGFTNVTIALQGEIKSSNFVPGSVGVMLIPDEEPILRIFREGKQVQLPIETSIPLLTGASEYFSKQEIPQKIAFARYRLYLYNTINRVVEANVYLYLTN